jgi:hypothetical protein
MTDSPNVNSHLFSTHHYQLTTVRVMLCYNLIELRDYCLIPEKVESNLGKHESCPDLLGFPLLG